MKYLLLLINHLGPVLNAGYALQVPEINMVAITLHIFWTVFEYDLGHFSHMLYIDHS